MISTLYRVQHTYRYINLFHDDFHAISWKKHTHIKDNPFHDDTTADEKYQFTCMIDFHRVFRDGTNVERINFRGGIVGNVKKTRCSLCTCNISTK
jgi:hypothetical protein